MGGTLQISECQLRLADPLRQFETPSLAEFFNREFREEVRSHSYDAEGAPRFQYPRVQFKGADSTAWLLGVNEGSELLQRLWPNIENLIVGEKGEAVLDSELETREEQLQSNAEPQDYQFVSPWLALNERNFREYTGTRNRRTRKDELSRILVGNTLGLAKSLGVSFDDRITADCSHLTSIKIALRDKGMIGFVGKFTLNVELPDYLGLGKSVALGFGAVTSC